MTSTGPSAHWALSCDTAEPPKWLTRLRYTSSWHTASPIDAELPCTAAKDRTCQIFDHLPVWNEVFYCIHYELRASSGKNGQLSLVSLGHGRRCLPTVEDLMDWQKANYLLSWLFKTHQCIDTLEFLFWDVYDKVSHPYDHLFCDAFGENKWLKTLKITFCRSHKHEKLSELISSCVRLERLECYSSLPAALSSALATLLRTTTSLTVLIIGALRITEEEAEDFLAALRENNTLKELSMCEPYNAEVSLLNRAEFAEYLKSSTTLATFSVSPLEATYYERESWWLWILEGLSESRTITRVRLENLLLGQETSPIIGKIFKQNSALRCLSMSSDRKPDDLRVSTVNPWWLLAFVQNKTLEEISLYFHMLSMVEWEMVFAAAARNENLRKVTVKVVSRDHYRLAELYRLIREAGAEKKVAIEAGSYFVGDHKNSPKCQAFSEVHGLRRQCTKRDICRALQQMPSLDHITSLLLRIPAVDLDDSLATDLSQCIKTATSLQKLRLTTTWGEAPGNVPNCSWKIVVSSFLENKSLKEIFVAAAYIKDEDIESLADAVKLNTVFRSAEFSGESSHKVNVFFRRLSGNIAENYNLLRVNFMAPAIRNSPSFQAWYAVWEVTRRNCDLVELAAVFVIGVRSDRYARPRLCRVLIVLRNKQSLGSFEKTRHFI
ncbi:hypothetical protein V5799_003120 [Amblyomma americanum]|uniref:Uncharacterized protein n=1 Tax=Amblyomma americanum TaxID=6943 RepID=A0AAQ4D9V8_AMBAM